MKDFKGNNAALLLFIMLIISCIPPRKCCQLNFRNYSNHVVSVKVAVKDSTYYVDYEEIAAGDVMEIHCLTADTYRGEVIISVNKYDSLETKVYTIKELRRKAMTVIYKNQLP